MADTQNGEGKGGAKGRKGGTGKTLFMIFALHAIIAVTVYFGVRTEGVRRIIEHRLSRQTGMEMTIDSTSVRLPAAMVMENVVSKDFAVEGGAGFKAFEMVTERGDSVGTKITVKRAVLNLVRGKDFKWKPEIFARLGEVPFKDETEVSRVAATFREDMELIVSDSNIRWLNYDGSELACAEGVSFEVVPMNIPGHRTFYHRLGVYNMLGVDGVRMHDIRREWISMETRDYIEINSSKQGVAATNRVSTESKE